MVLLSDYTDLITSEHRLRPKFVATITALLQPIVDATNILLDMPNDFDIDTAIGSQLDVVGIWVGISRDIAIPLTGIYFSFDIVGVGFDQGAWKGKFDPDTGMTSLDDDTYRLLLKAKIGANHWDGTLGTSASILSSIFPDDTHVFIQDNQDMTMTIGIAGQIPSAVFLALLKGGYIPIKPEGVGVDIVIVTSVDDTPIFGFDINNDYISGFDMGSWGKSL